MEEALKAVNSAITDWTSGYGAIKVGTFETFIPPYVWNANS